MSTNVKKAAADALGRQIALLVPALADRIQVGQADDETIAQGRYPILAILPGKMKLEPWQEGDEHEDVDSTRHVMDVGCWDGTYELRLYAKGPGEREGIEASILEVFGATEGAPGLCTVLMPRLNIGGVGITEPGLAAFVLGDSDWQEEMVFARRRYSFITLDASLPFLVMRRDFTIEEFQLAIEQIDTANAPAEELADIDEDGNVTPVT